MSEPTKPPGCLRILVFCALYGIMGGTIYHFGCEDASVKTSINPTADPNIRHIGFNGAVLGTDQHGLTTRLSPGTTVRRTSTTANGQQVYVVVNGEWAGAPVPLSESDLEPQ